RESARRIVPKTPDVAGAPSKLRAGGDRSRHLAAGKTGELFEPVFRVRGRMRRHDRHVIHAVLPQPNDVEGAALGPGDREGKPHLVIIIDLRLSFAYSSGCDRTARPFPPWRCPCFL